MLAFRNWNIQQKLIGLIVLAFCLCWIMRYNIIEKFIDGDICNKCPDRLLSDGTKYYLLNLKLPIDGKINPIIFNTLDDYAKNKPAECPLLTPITKADEPVLPLQHKCNRENALDEVKYNDCRYKIYTRFTKEECEKELSKNTDTNFAIDRCMMDQVIKDNTQLNPFTKS